MINQTVIGRIKPGATVRVFEKVKEGDKERLARFEGLVLARKHGREAGASFLVRATIAGVGVEKVFPLHSPHIEKVEIVTVPKKVRRSKLYYVRDISRSEIRRKISADLKAVKDLQLQLQKEKDAELAKAKAEADLARQSAAEAAAKAKEAAEKKVAEAAKKEEVKKE